MIRGYRRFSTRIVLRSHENPLGIPRNRTDGKPTIPRMQRGIPEKRKLPNVDKIVAVSSAKGGVGKSTVSANTAVALALQGKRVGLLDADIFGPSIPKLMNLQGEPRLSKNNRLIPLSNYGVKTMSMGYLVGEDAPVAWRGLMVMKALQQLIYEVEWDGLDYLVIDMPPGTGDTQLTLTQQLVIDGAIVVSTPQDIALIDAIKGINMFHKVHVPVLGLVQNMSMFVCPNCNHESHIFGSDGAIKEAKKQNIDVLGSIPLAEAICLNSDNGIPIVIADKTGTISKHYRDIAATVSKKLEEEN
ncbi:hypothetical protein CANCADRAFT_130421 [Tortispora caseinolytica NRRL Y-17796]|uniref:Uncharacterized protein n=1 Tax=Tortispora caseinolytica NRRL Y-17796 TaxID=767744 RepID=A0A1E4TAR9_9ASCO|nr:hypothetical protein CANCADRAFT_130421 [Tortispora caseinolytica NRRL Y-17796]